MKRMLFPFLTALLGCLALSASVFALPAHMQFRMGTMEGQVFLDGKPLANVLLSFFLDSKGLPPIPGGMGRIPESLDRTDSEGKFKVRLPEGSYYMGILLRGPDEKLGPPRQGESFYFASDGQGRLRHLTIKDFEKVDHGRIECSIGSAFSEAEEDSFTVQGTVLEGKGGAPVAGALVLAKKGDQQMRRPDYFSAPSSDDGKFSINLPPGDTYFLLARKLITGARPSPGDSIGKFGTDSTDKSLSAIRPEGVGPPPGVSEDQSFKSLSNEALPVTGDAGQVIAGITIYMYDMPETGPKAQKPIQQKIRRASGAPRFAEGVTMKLLFATNSHEIDPQSYSELDEWSGFLKGEPELRIELSGHTDNVGSEEYNLELSRKRADAVAQYLIGKGIEPRRITVNGYGSTRPYVDNSTEERRRRNRRVDIKFIR